MYSHQVHAVQRHVDHPGEPPLDRHPPSDEISHQATNGGKPAHRYERALVTIDKCFRRFPGNQVKNITISRRCQLVRSLSAWRHRAARALWLEKAAIAYGKDTLIPGRLQGGKDDKLPAARHLKSVKLFKNTWPLHSCGPDTNIGLYLLSGSTPQARFRCFRYSCICEHPDAEGLEFLMRCLC
jgi:hypothetical protein